jgi:GNAT superfamily N-acetyltransferase
VGVRKIDAQMAELKRMYIRPGHRSKGYGKKLLNQGIALAKTLGYKKLRLDTLPSMQVATHLYKQAGFIETVHYRFNPVNGTKYFELLLPNE